MGDIRRDVADFLMDLTDFTSNLFSVAPGKGARCKRKKGRLLEITDLTPPVTIQLEW